LVESIVVMLTDPPVEVTDEPRLLTEKLVLADTCLQSQHGS